MFEAGLDVTSADLIVGTSAGSTAAAQVTNANPTNLFTDILAAAPQPQSNAARGTSSSGQVSDHLDRRRALIAASADVAEMRRAIGAEALEASSMSDMSAQWRATVAERLPSRTWPQQRILITAVDAHTGNPVVFDRDSGVDLVDAVAASCSSGFAYEIGEGRYIDGGYRTNADNADLAAGYARVLVLSPFGGKALTPVGWGMHLTTQVGQLRANGAMVETIFPGSESEHMFGANAMNFSLRPAAAQSGHKQGISLAQELTALWH